MAHPPVGSSSSSIVSGAGDDRAGEGGQQRGAGTSATSGPVADGGHGSGSGSGDAAGMKPKKKKKKGWKGWALVLEDEEGNVIEVRDRGESPETEKRRVEEDAEKDRAGGTEVAASRGELGILGGDGIGDPAMWAGPSTDDRRFDGNARWNPGHCVGGECQCGWK